MKLLFFIQLITISTAIAHLGTIVGKITDGKTKQPIRGANILLTWLNRGTISDDAGYFQINNLSPTPKVSFMGYVVQK